MFCEWVFIRLENMLRRPWRGFRIILAHCDLPDECVAGTFSAFFRIPRYDSFSQLTEELPAALNTTTVVGQC